MPVVASAERLSGSLSFARSRVMSALLHAGACGAAMNARGEGACFGNAATAW
jgi:hypothetical protein